MDRQKIVSSLDVLWRFIDSSFGIDKTTCNLTGFDYSKELLEACAFNTYLETIGNKADSIYAYIKNGMTEMTKHSYLYVIGKISKRFELNKKGVVLAFDYTDEDFYGDVQGFDIHGWTGDGGVTGKFKFLTCSIVAEDVPQKIPLISIPIRLGHNMSYAISHCLELIKPFIGNITLILFDRQFYAKELMYDLNKMNKPYLIFVPKDVFIKNELEQMEDKEEKIIEHKYEFCSGGTTLRFESRLAFLKQIFCKKLEKNIDWVFATNVDDIKLDGIIKTYKERWRIETGFRVQDDALIKCKSKNMRVRYFIFMFQQLLQTQWMCFFKEEVSFKQFIIEMYRISEELVKSSAERKSKTILNRNGK